MSEEQLQEWREFADHMGSDISVKSIQYQLAKMVWTLVDEVLRLKKENKTRQAAEDRMFDGLERMLNMDEAEA